jgi:hypothetical protein
VRKPFGSAGTDDKEGSKVWYGPRVQSVGSRDDKPGSADPFLPAGETDTIWFGTNLMPEETAKIYDLSKPHYERTRLYVELKFAYQDGLGNTKDLHQCFVFDPHQGDFVGSACPAYKEQ